jgi:hypothetical protein
MDFLSWFKRSKTKGKPASAKARSTSATPYAGAEVVPGKDGCCEAVRAIAKQRFLCKEAPLIPLRDCNQSQCTCTYRRFADRRTNERRVVDLGAGISHGFARQSSDRRRMEIPGRRSEDLR